MKLIDSFRNYAPLLRSMQLRVAFSMIFTLFIISVYGQAEQSPDFMRSVGKIYVVASVTIVILITLFIYLIILDRKISRIEKRQKNE